MLLTYLRYSLFPNITDPLIRVINWKSFFLFLNQNICCGYSKEPSQWDGSSEHPKHMLKLIYKKILTILPSTILLTYLWYSLFPNITDPLITVKKWKSFFLSLNQNICCGYSKEPSQWDDSFEHPKHMFKLIYKKILTILPSTILLTYLRYSLFPNRYIIRSYCNFRDNTTAVTV